MKKSNYQFNIVDNIIFIHIPKNAGTTIAKSLGFDSTTHIKAFEIEQKYKSQVKGKFIFAIVRNPIDRFLSLYNYARMDVSYYHNNIEPSKSLYGKHFDYKILKDASLYKCAKLLQEGKLTHDTSWNHWKPQYTWVYDKQLKNRLVNNVYKIENLNDLQKDIFEKFNMYLNFKKVNKSKRKSNINNIDSKTLSIIKEYYRKDFELFDYKL